ncbi:MAG TPA: VOC family protein [Chthonomonadaceae bacterium]|nr:VOC family protein [Chthonomonadaceae bacterium]
MSSLNFSHVAINCKDPLAVERFYTKYFGFTRARVIPLGEQQIVFIKCGTVYLEIFRAEGEAPSPVSTGDGPHYTPSWRHIAFQVDSVDAKLQEMGQDAKITLGPLDFDAFIPGWRTVWVADPEGNIVEISQGYVDQENPPALPD